MRQRQAWDLDFFGTSRLTFLRARESRLMCAQNINDRRNSGLELVHQSHPARRVSVEESATGPLTGQSCAQSVDHPHTQTGQDGPGSR
jgi:hypothetical protein